MREIKCKFWDKEENKMIGPKLEEKYSIRIDTHGALYLVDTSREDEDGYDYEMDGIFLQYTGLKDKNGKEIYEGDIIQGRNTLYNVRWIENLAKFGVMVVKSDYILTRGCTFPIHQYVKLGTLECIFEVVGNIHENPELLEAPHG